jgi:ATP-dependent DNA ligase
MSRSHLQPPLPPMEAESVDEIPVGPRWQYEPKWDGFRCLAFREADKVTLQSKSGQPLGRYFPDLVAGLQALSAKHFVLDGEIVIPVSGVFSFDELLMRIHPAASRVARLAAEHPALYIVFDLLAAERGAPLIEQTLRQRRQRLESFAGRNLPADGQLRLSPATTNLKTAQQWFRKVGGNLDGLIAKRLDLPYQSGNRDGMQKIKQIRTCDCVVGGFRYADGKKVVGSLLLGLYDDQGLLHHVGFTASFKAAERAAITQRVEKLVEPPGFTGRAPGGPSRWSTRRSDEWQPLAQKLVVEVEYDHFTGDRFRHGTHFLRWRPDKAPRQCTLDQVARRGGKTIKLLDSA